MQWTSTTTLVGTSTFTESLNGFYSDSYKGEEVYDVQGETWQLVSGYGNGNGENKSTNTNKLDTVLTMLLATDSIAIPNAPPGGPTSEIIPHYTDGNYTSYYDVVNAETFQVEFTVDNGEWERDIIVTNQNTLKHGYDFSIAGDCTFITITDTTTNSTGDHTLDESGKRDVTVTTMEVWRPGVLPGSQVWISYEQDTKDIKEDHSYYLRHIYYTPVVAWCYSETYDQQYTLTIHKEGVSSGDAVTTFDINGTASGQYIHEGIYDQYGIPLASWYQEFKNGRIYRDLTTNQIAGMSESMSSYSVSMNPDPSASHGWIFIDYNDFTEFVNGVNTVYNKIYVRSFSEPHKMYYDNTFIPHKATIDYYGESTGVTFGEAEPIDPAIFDSGIENYRSEQEAATYQPMDTSNVVPGVPMAGIELGDAIREGLDKLEEAFAALSYEDKMKIINNTKAATGWDMTAFAALGSPSNYYDDWINNVPAGMEALLGSVTIDGVPYWGAEANYILWGFAHRMFHEHLLASGGGETIGFTTTPILEGAIAQTHTFYRNPDGKLGKAIITLEDTLFWVKAWRLARYGLRSVFDETNPERRSSGPGIEGRLVFAYVGWLYYGEGPGKRGGFSILPAAQILDRPVQANPSNLANIGFTLDLYIGGVYQGNVAAKVPVAPKDKQ